MKQPLVMVGSRWAHYFATYRPPKDMPRYRTEPHKGKKYFAKFQRPPEK